MLLFYTEAIRKCGSKLLMRVHTQPAKNLWKSDLY